MKATEKKMNMVNQSNEKQFLSELKVLLEKYNASIAFTCSDSSDTHGLHKDSIIVKIGRKEILRTGFWAVTAQDID